MSVLLAIIATPQDEALLKRHWPYFKMTGWDILGAGTLGGKTVWPEAVPRLDTGIIGKRPTPAGESIWGLVQQECDIWRWFLNQTEYDSVAVVEADGLFTRPLPDHPGGAYLFTVMPSFSPAGLFKSPIYAQTPRWSDRPTTERLLMHAEQMIKTGDSEWWMSDRLPAWICYKHHIKFQGFPGWSPFAMTPWTANSYEVQWVQDARMAIQMGAAYIHSCKTQRQFDALKDLLPSI